MYGLDRCNAAGRHFYGMSQGSDNRGSCCTHKTVKSCILQRGKAADMRVLCKAMWKSICDCHISSAAVQTATARLMYCVRVTIQSCCQWCVPLKQLNCILCSIVVVSIVTTLFSLRLGLISVHCVYKASINHFPHAVVWVDGSVTQFNSRIAAQGPNSKWNESEIVHKNNKNQNVADRATIFLCGISQAANTCKPCKLETS